MHERAPVSQDTSLNSLTTKPSNSPHRIEPVSSTCVPEDETGKSKCKLCYSFIPAPFLLALFSPKFFYNNMYSNRYMFNLNDYSWFVWIVRFLPEKICMERAEGRFEFSTMFIYIHMTVLTHLCSLCLMGFWADF